MNVHTYLSAVSVADASETLLDSSLDRANFKAGRLASSWRASSLAARLTSGKEAHPRFVTARFV